MRTVPPAAHSGRVLKRELTSRSLSANRLALDIGAIMGGTISMKSVRHAFAVVDDIKKGQAP